MASILKSPYYFGEISIEETKNILLQEPHKSYLFRRLQNGKFTWAIVYDSIKGKRLFEMEVRTRINEEISIPIDKFKRLFKTPSEMEDCLKFFRTLFRDPKTWTKYQNRPKMQNTCLNFGCMV